jgi:hypothetical protein
MHIHYCDAAGHEWQCSENCECFCGLPMEQGNHSECPVELRACPEHKDETERQVTAIESTAAQIDFTSLCEKREQPRLHCQCGCADSDPASIVGWCLWCGHGYVEYIPKIENQHFAYDCPGAPVKLKQTALASLEKRGV